MLLLCSLVLTVRGMVGLQPNGTRTQNFERCSNEEGVCLSGLILAMYAGSPAPFELFHKEPSHLAREVLERQLGLRVWQGFSEKIPTRV